MYFAHARLDRQRQCCLGKTAWQVIACAITKQMTSNDQTRRCRTSLQANLCKLRRLKLQSGLQVAKGWNVLALGNLDVAKNLDHKVQKIVEVMYVERLLVLLCSTPAWCQVNVKAILEEQQKRKQVEMALKDAWNRCAAVHIHHDCCDYGNWGPYRMSWLYCTILLLKVSEMSPDSSVNPKHVKTSGEAGICSHTYHIAIQQQCLR